MEAPNELEQKIITQIEFYFGDINYGRDKFMLTTAKENDGWIPLETLMRFNRLKALSTDQKEILRALSKSNSDLIEIEDNDDGKARLRRAKPIVSDDLSFWREKGFPLDYKIGDIEKVLRPYGNLQSVVMRRVAGPDRLFKGSVFATYATKEECEKLVAADPIILDGCTEPLIKMLQPEYHRQKNERMKALRAQTKADKAAAKPESKKAKADAKPQMPAYESGCLLRLTGLAEGTTYQMVKDVVKPMETGKSCYVELDEEKHEAIVRVSAPRGERKPAQKEEVKEEEKAATNGDASETADATVPVASETIAEKAARAALNADGKLIINGAEVQWSLVTGDDEKAYYMRLAQSKQAADKRAKEKMRQNKGHKGSSAEERAKKRKAADKALHGGKIPRAEGTHTKFGDSDEGEDNGAENSESKTETTAAAE